MPLTVGTKAPDFILSTKTADGPKQVKLSDNFGKKNTLLLFFPMAFTGTCTTEMCDVSNGLSAYSNMNAAVYGISGDNPFAQEAWAQKEKITVPLPSSRNSISEWPAWPSVPHSSSTRTAWFNTRRATTTPNSFRTSTRSNRDWRN